MSRASVVIRNAADRMALMTIIRRAAFGTRVDVKEAKRTLPQNDRFWAMCTDIARQASINGKRYTPDQWRSILMQAWGKEVRHLPTLDGDGFFPVYSSSDLGKSEMTDLIEFLFAWGAQNGVRFADERVAA